MDIYAKILYASLGILAFFGVIAIIFENRFIYDVVLAILFLSFLYLYRKKFSISEGHFIFISAVIIAHNAGVFGAYGLDLGNIGYDLFVHYFAGFIIWAATYRYFRIGRKIRKERAIALAFIFLIALTAVHELVEYQGEEILGDGEGIFFNGPGDASPDNPYDTMEDIINNILGGLTAMAVYLGMGKGKFF